MHRIMRDKLTLLLAGAALFGAAGITRAESTTIKHQLVQQTNPGMTERAGSAADRAADQAGSAADRAAGQAGSATDRAAGQVEGAIDRSTGQAGSQGGQGQSGNPAQAGLPQGITPKDYGDVRGDVRDTLGATAKAALTRDNFGDLRDQLAKSDRDRLATNDNSYPDELNRAIDQFNQTWQGTYSASFDLDANTAFPDQFLAATAGEVSNPQQISNWPVAPRGQQPSPETRNPTMNQGTGVAVATFTSQQGQPPLHISLIREMGGWKIDVPDSVTADQLKSSLARHLSEVTNMKSQWPQDQAQAQRIVTGHILMALYNLQSGGQQGSQGGQSSQQPSSMGDQPGQAQPQPHSDQTTQTQGGQSGQQGTSTQQPGQPAPQPRSDQTTQSQSGHQGSPQPSSSGQPQGSGADQSDMEE